MKGKINLDWTLPLGLGLVIVLGAGLGIPLYQTGVWRVYDLFLTLKPKVAEHPDIGMVVIDDNTIAELKMYPLSRDLIAGGVITMGEFQARALAIDSEFVDISPLGIRKTYLDESVPRYFREVFDDLFDQNAQILLALSEGRLSAADVNDILGQLQDLTVSQEAALLERVQGIIRDNDTFLGQAARFMGHVHATITPTVYAHSPESLKSEFEAAYLRDEGWLNQIREARLPRAQIVSRPSRWGDRGDAVGLSPSILPVLAGSRGAGSVNQEVDLDGVRRRVLPVFEWEGGLYPQLSLSAFLDWVGDPELVLESNRLILKQAQIPGQAPKDIEIPLDDRGMMNLNWVRGNFLDTFFQVSFYELWHYRETMEDLAATWREMETLGYFDVFDSAWPRPLELWDQAEMALQLGFEEGGEEARRAYGELRADFVEASRFLVDSEWPDAVQAAFEEALADPSLEPAFQENLRSRLEPLEGLFAAARTFSESAAERQTSLRQKLSHKYLVLGYIGKSTTDIGVTPFESEYMNVGTMATVANTIAVGAFLQDTPWWLSLILLMPLAMGLTVLVARLSPVKGSLLGFGAMLGVFFMQVMLFSFSGLYTDGLQSLLLLGLTTVGALVINFRRSNSQKAFITDAFGQYLSESVIQELLQDPTKLKLGGEEKEMTAIFTDVKGFSTFSEMLTPTELVSLLNEYLTVMSDIVIENSGTIDKYEGDAIIAFFGAPGFLPDHAKRSVTAAVAMKKAEEALNQRLYVEEKKAPTPIKTRIGINTGPMVVGNMGTTKKKNYTIMGNAVNLAARLEGVNKQYGTWILISESTHDQLGGEFLTRRLDRVRVVGVSTPLRLFEVIDHKALAPAYAPDLVEVFHQGLDAFESRDFAGAVGYFQKALKILPEDATSQIYLQRAQDFLQNPPPAEWDGVTNMTSK